MHVFITSSTNGAYLSTDTCVSTLPADGSNTAGTNGVILRGYLESFGT